MFLRLFRNGVAIAALFCFPVGVLAGFSDEIVLTVGDYVMTRSEFEVEKSFFIKANQVTFATPLQSKTFEQDFAKMYVETQLQLLVGQSMNIVLDGGDLDMIKREMLVRHGVESEEDFKSLLASKGVDYAMFMKQAERQYLLKKIHGYVLGSKIRLSDQEVDNAYAKELSKNNLLYVEDIFYSTEHAAKAQHPKIKANSQFVSDVWKKGTFSANTVPKRGKMLTFKWQKIDSLPSQFIAIVANMNVGDVSDPVLTDNGYHVLKLIKKKLPADVRINKDQIKQQLYVERMATELPKWLDALREQTYVNIHLR